MADGLAERTRPETVEGKAETFTEADSFGDDVGVESSTAGQSGMVEPYASWADVWQVPTIIASVLLIAAGLVVAMHRAPKDDFGGALAHVERQLAAGELEAAGLGLAKSLEPNLDIATVPQRARFHACVADWISMAQIAEGVDREENNVRVHEQFGRARELGHDLSAPRLERWGHALTSLNMLEEARQRIADLEAVARRDPEADVRERQGRLFRRIIATMLQQPGFDEALVMELLGEYRSDRRATLDDHIWAIARQSEVRLQTGRPQEAIDRLLIDMRRIEHESDADPPVVAELYALLGRAYFNLGRTSRAATHLELAAEDDHADPNTLAMANTLLGRIAASSGDIERAFEHFDLVVRDYNGSPSHLNALLGRAQTYSLLGKHELGRADYIRLVQALHKPANRHLLSLSKVASSLIERHDSGLARGDLKTALSYVKIAETLFQTNEVPIDVLLRVAMTCRQIADDLMTEVAQRNSSLDAETLVRLRHEANTHYRQAGEYYVRHARILVALPGGDEDWSTSLWNGADSYDLGGFHELAITHFEEYLAGRSGNDPRRSDARFRLAQCFHALAEHDKAIVHYEQVIAEHPRSAVATKSHVPLAQCYLALDRRSEAEQQLKQVLAGLLPIQPSAADYRAALLQLAELYYQSHEYADAIARFHEAAERYPNDETHLVTLFRLADSYRGLALQLDERLRLPSPDSPGERRRIEEHYREHLVTARDYYELVSDGYLARDPAELEPHERDIARLADLYRADCAFFLGDYEAAIALYDQAARRYSEHHSSLHALVQIVNAYSALGDEERAAVAHRRALVRLGQLPERAFEAPDVLMDREAWERWLSNAPLSERRLTAVEPD